MSTRRRKRSNARVAIVVIATLAILLGLVAMVSALFIKAPEIPTDTQQEVEQEEEDIQEEGENQEELDEAAAALAEAEAARIAAHAVRKDGFYTILVSGVDDGNGGSDTNILFGIDTQNDTIHGLSIPRDTKSTISGTDYKINAAYNIGGTELMAETISDMLGIPVDFTVEVSLEAFVDLVDTIGGVTFNVPIDMDYDDPYQDLSIHFTAGTQLLSGEEALGVVRFRQNNDGTGYGSQDLGRMATQQAFLTAVAKQTLTAQNVDKISTFASIFQTYVDTDLSLGNLVWLGSEALTMGSDALSFSTLAGEWISPYIYADPEQALETVNTYLNPYEELRTADDLNVPT